MKYVEAIADAEDENIYKEVPEGYNKTDYHARKTCNYLTTAVEVTLSDLFSRSK